MTTTTDPMDTPIGLTVTAEQFTVTILYTNGNRLTLTRGPYYIANLMTKVARGQRPDIALIGTDNERPQP